MSTLKSIKRYNPVLVSLHWLVVLLVFGALLFLGGGEGGEDGSATGASSTSLHMIVGIVVLVVMTFRLIVRLRTPRPEWAATGNDLLNKLGEWTHYGLYFFTFAITITGIALAAQTNRLATLFSGGAGGGEAEGESIRLGLGAFHGMSWTILLLLILLHVAGWAYHQFMLKDNLISRMWYGGQSE